MIYLENIKIMGEITIIFVLIFRRVVLLILGLFDFHEELYYNYFTHKKVKNIHTLNKFQKKLFKLIFLCKIPFNIYGVISP